MTSIEIITERKRKIMRDTMRNFRLDLSGLTVFTEAATGNYLYTPIMAALSGAEHVFAVTSDSVYGSKEEVKKQILEEASILGIHDKITVLFVKDNGCLSVSDIITNLGFVRPITKQMVDWMKPTAVIPFMRLGDEIRAGEIDLEACRKRSIVVLGTDENHHDLRLLDSTGFKICKLLFERGFSVWSDKLLLIGSGDLCNYPTYFFMKNDIFINRVIFNDDIPMLQRPLLLTKKQVLKDLSSYDAIIVNEFYSPISIISDKGFIPVKLLKKMNPSVQIIHLMGNINAEQICREGLELYPRNIRPFGYMSVSSDYLGVRCTLKLNAAGLKVAEVASKCRLRGMSVIETEKYALRNSPAMRIN